MSEIESNFLKYKMCIHLKLMLKVLVFQFMSMYWIEFRNNCPHMMLKHFSWEIIASIWYHKPLLSRQLLNSCISFDWLNMWHLSNLPVENISSSKWNSLHLQNILLSKVLLEFGCSQMLNLSFKKHHSGKTFHIRLFVLDRICKDEEYHHRWSQFSEVK